MRTRSTSRTLSLFPAQPEHDAELHSRDLVPAEPAIALEPLTVRIPTAMKLTGIGRSKLYELIASGDIEIVKVGTATLVTMTSLRKLVAHGAR